MLLVALVVLVVAGAFAAGAFEVWHLGGWAAKLGGKLLALGSFLTFMMAIACVVLAFGVDFR